MYLGHGNGDELPRELLREREKRLAFCAVLLAQEHMHDWHPAPHHIVTRRIDLPRMEGCKIVSAINTSQPRNHCTCL